MSFEGCLDVAGDGLAAATSGLFRQMTGMQSNPRGVVCGARLEADNNIAENAIRGIALGRHNWLFAGSHSGGERAADVLDPSEAV